MHKLLSPRKLVGRGLVVRLSVTLCWFGKYSNVQLFELGRSSKRDFHRPLHSEVISHDGQISGRLGKTLKELWDYRLLTDCSKVNMSRRDRREGERRREGDPILWPQPTRDLEESENPGEVINEDLRSTLHVGYYVPAECTRAFVAQVQVAPPESAHREILEGHRLVVNTELVTKWN